MNKPYIIKFSGGRSSGMMLINLLKRGLLNSKRGDVIVFNNTSAEHPATYEFTRKIKEISEKKYNIPFFWTEYQTYEDSNNSHRWSRKPSYRLVNDRPYSSNNKNGYHYKGEVFEEVVSLGGYLPNMLSRTCTLSMKIFVTNSFLSDWLAQKTHIERLGHYGKNAKMTDDDIIFYHKKSHGTVPDHILLSKREFVKKCDFIRKKQYWKNFTKADIKINNESLKESILGNKAQLYGDLAIDYISCLGIRSDEKRRIVKIRNRIEESQNKKGKSLFNQPHGEIILAPLVDENITKNEVTYFWNEQDFDLDLPNTGVFSNCLYCPLKGKEKLLHIATKEMSCDNSEITPASIDWWIEIEKKYSRNLVAEKRKITSNKNPVFIGFFGATKNMVFEKIKEKAQTGVLVNKESLEIHNYIPCNCTD